MVILWTRALQQRFDAAEPPIAITTISVHPGSVATTMVKGLQQPFRWILEHLWITAAEGSYNPLFAAASKEVAAKKDKYKGQYLSVPVGSIEKVGEAIVDDERVKNLWDTTERYLRSIDV
jgi:NAD(P)-dependent dehydrogenase (short-subunit alcohol dehydrogenase family)